VLVSPGHWTYYGAAHRFDVHGDAEEELRCDRTMSGLTEDELRAQALLGDRCAFIALIEILVDQDRTDDLRAMADGGDDRARRTLMELLANQGREAELRAEVAAGRGHAESLLTYLCGRGRLDDALDELIRWTDDHPEDAWWAHAQRLDMLLQGGRADEVEREAAAGDRVAIRLLRALGETLGRPVVAERPSPGP